MSEPDKRSSEVAVAFGVRLRGVRVQAGITREELARDAGLDLDVLDQVESGAEEAGVSALIQTATALGVPMNLLLDGIRWQVKEGRFEIAEPPEQFVAGT